MALHLEPTPVHPITIAPTTSTVTVRVGEAVVARTDRALTLQEAAYPAVQYVPLSDVDPAVLLPSTSSTYCPYKGDASYYGISTPDGTVLDDAIWTYRTPYPAVALIADHVAFYPDQVSIEIG